MKYKTLLCLTAIFNYYNIDAQNSAKGLEEKVQELADISAEYGIVLLNFNTFKEYVKSPPRDYSFIVMFSAMAPSRRCAICHYMYDEYRVVAISFRLSHSFSDKLFFGMVDFDDGSDVFQMLRLNTVPVIMHFPAEGKPKPADSMDFERAGIHAEAIIKWIQDRTDVQIRRVFRPPNYPGTILFAMVFVLITGFLYLMHNNLKFLYSKQMWAVIAIFFCFTMVSGQMWNQIRGPLFFDSTKNGPVYINGSSHGQFLLESYIVAALNGAVVVGMILMIEAAGGVKRTDIHRAREGKRRRFQYVVGLVLVCVFFSLLLSVFRSKTQGYPYSFLFK